MPVEYPISRYRKVQKPNDNVEANQIKIKINAPPFSYTAYAGKLLLSGEHNIVSLFATGAAGSTLVKVVEHLRHNLNQLHVVYKITKRQFEDEYQPLEEGLDKVISIRTVSTLEAHMALEPQEGFEGENGYMAPLDEEEVNQEEFEDILMKYALMKEAKKANASQKSKNNSEASKDDSDGQPKKKKKKRRRNKKKNKSPVAKEEE